MTLSELRATFDIVGFAFEAAGVAVIAGGTVVAARIVVTQHMTDLASRYACFRRELGAVIVLGLEFLVAGDIIRTVAIDPSLRSVAALGLIVVIRTFLSMALQVEIDGCWPGGRRLPQSPRDARAQAQPRDLSTRGGD